MSRINRAVCTIATCCYPLALKQVLSVNAVGISLNYSKYSRTASMRLMSGAFELCALASHSQPQARTGSPPDNGHKRFLQSLLRLEFFAVFSDVVASDMWRVYGAFAPKKLWLRLTFRTNRHHCLKLVYVYLLFIAAARGNLRHWASTAHCARTSNDCWFMRRRFVVESDDCVWK